MSKSLIFNIMNKILIPISILLASIILGGVFYATQINKQRSIERQQEMEITESRRIEEMRQAQESKEYVAKRKNECYALYEKERAKWNNVKSNEYNEEKDVCLIRYKAADEWKGKNCDDLLPADDASEYLEELALKNYWDCKDNSFTNEF